MLRVARAARKLIQDHPLASHNSNANNEQSSSLGDPYLVNLSPSSQSDGRRSLISESSFIKSEGSEYQSPQGFQAGGPPPSSSSGLPPNAALSTSGGISEGTSTRDVSVQNGNLDPSAAATEAAAAPTAQTTAPAVNSNGCDEEDYSKYASIPGIATRNGGFEALAFPDGIFS